MNRDIQAIEEIWYIVNELVKNHDLTEWGNHADFALAYRIREIIDNRYK